jgi:hypothetical protein
MQYWKEFQGTVQQHSVEYYLLNPGIFFVNDCIITIATVIIPLAKRGVYAIGGDSKGADICTRS